jgi:hypothetical protein
MNFFGLLPQIPASHQPRHTLLADGRPLIDKVFVNAWRAVPPL